MQVVSYGLRVKETFTMKQFIQFFKEMTSRSNKEKAMSLIEIIIVVTLMVSLLAIFARSYIKTQEGVQADQVKIQLGLLAQELEKFRATNYKYPTDLGHLVTDPGTYKNWRGPYVEETKIKDVWGEEFEYSIEGRKFKIMSSGLDQEFDTDDDIVYPEEKPTNEDGSDDDQ